MLKKLIWLSPHKWLFAYWDKKFREQRANMTAHQYDFTVYYLDRDDSNGTMVYDKWFIYDPDPEAIFDGIDIDWRVSDHSAKAIEDGIRVDDSRIPRHRILKVEWTKRREIKGYNEYVETLKREGAW